MAPRYVTACHVTQAFCQARDKDSSIQKAYADSCDLWFAAHNEGKRLRETAANSKYAPGLAAGCKHAESMLMFFRFRVRVYAAAIWEQL